MVSRSIATKLRAAGSVSASPITSSNALPWGGNPTAASAVAVGPSRENAGAGRPPYRSGAGIDASRRQQHTMTTGNVLITPPPPPPPLLLEGDEMFLSPTGKSHTVYRLNDVPGGVARDSDLILEETYDIERARKRMSLLGPRCLLDKDTEGEEGGGADAAGLADIFSFDLQEINHGVQNGSGTGSMSWDSSIVMGLYFGRKPNELLGSVLELGSGVGLGGILSNAATGIVRGDAYGRTHMTLSDVNNDVLDMLRRNMDSASRSSRDFACDKDHLSIEKLDWFDFLRDTPASPTGHNTRYDTIIASDCAYLKSQADPLSETISTLLGNDGGHERLHVFAPHNRSAIHDLVGRLHEKEMETRVEYIDMSKYRVKQHGSGGGILSPEGRYWNGQPPGAVRGLSKFIHITAWHRLGPRRVDNASEKGRRMSDID